MDGLGQDVAVDRSVLCEQDQMRPQGLDGGDVRIVLPRDDDGPHTKRRLRPRAPGSRVLTLLPHSGRGIRWLQVTSELGVV